MKMTTDTITLEKKSFIAEWLKSLAKPVNVVIDGEIVVEVNPVRVHTTTLEDTWGPDWDKETEEDRQAYKEAMEDYKNGETLELDFSKVKNLDEAWNLIINESKKYEV